MTTNLLGSSELTITDCCACGVVFAVPERLLVNRQQKGGDFYCPNGHSLTYSKPEVQRLREQLDRVNARARHYEDQAQAAERSATALRGANTKLRKRIAAGVCPCCKRSFQNLARHMAGQHPDYAEQEASHG